MASPARFLFDKDFSAPSPREAAEPSVARIALADHERLLSAAIEEAHGRGLEEGRAAAIAESARRLADEAARLAAAASAMLSILDGERARIEAEALTVAEIASRKLAGRLVDLHPRQMILDLLAEAIGSLAKAPHVVVRLSETDVGPIKEALDRIAHERGFGGRLVVLGEPALSRGDCRIEWADGGIVLDRAATEAEVARIIEAHIALIAPAPDTRSEAEQ